MIDYLGFAVQNQLLRILRVCAPGGRFILSLRTMRLHFLSELYLLYLNQHSLRGQFENLLDLDLFLLGNLLVDILKLLSHQHQI